VIPSFYDSIELKREHLIEKFLARQARWNVVISVGLTGLEILASIVGARLIYRGLKAIFGRFFGLSRATA
jgi:HAE1 family hydrophobic/amphiphilic exporter-1